MRQIFHTGRRKELNENLLERLVLNLAHEMVPHVHANVSLQSTHHAPVEYFVLADLC